MFNNNNEHDEINLSNEEYSYVFHSCDNEFDDFEESVEPFKSPFSAFSDESIKNFYEKFIEKSLIEKENVPISDENDPEKINGNINKIIFENKKKENDDELKEEKKIIEFSLKSTKNTIIKPNKNEGKSKQSNGNNLTKKAKPIIQKATIKYVNKQIRKIYNGKISNGMFKKELKNIRLDENKKTDKESNKKFLERTLKETFQVNIRQSHTSFPSDFNIKLIEELLNEKDEEKRIFLNDLFNMTFSDFIKKLSEPDEELREIFAEILSKKNIVDENELYQIMYYINNFERIIDEKKSRARKKGKIEKNHCFSIN